MKISANIMCPISMLMIFVSTNALCADSNITPPSTSSMTLCPKAVINSMTVTNSNQNITLVPSDCTTDYTTVNTAGGGWGFFIFGGGYIGFDPSCPPDHPFLGGFNEQWGGTWFWWFGTGGGGATMTATCCNRPQQPTMSLSTGYDPANPTTYDTWASAPTCP